MGSAYPSIWQVYDVVAFIREFSLSDQANIQKWIPIYLRNDLIAHIDSYQSDTGSCLPCRFG